MAPVKNPNTANPNSNSTNDCVESARNSARSTGTVPKATTTTAKRLASLIKQQLQQQQQQQQQEHRKNIVEPLTRELKTLNEYLLATANNASNNGSNNNNTSNNQNQQEQHAIDSSLCATNYESIENLPENQSFCYPVRPIQRVQHQPLHTPAGTHPQQKQRFQLQQNDTNSTFSTTAAIGVVIPTTTVANNNNNNNSVTSDLPQQQQQQPQQQQPPVLAPALQELVNSYRQPTGQAGHSSTLRAVSALYTPITSDTNLTFDQLIKTILSLDTSSSAAATRSIQQLNAMVHEINPNPTETDVVVNSASLEDVALSEMSDRAQSIQSLHSMLETPTPDTTPSYEELQQRLEASNLNIQNIQEKQAQLLRLQNVAKDHLSDMEQLRQQAQGLSFSNGRRLSNGTVEGGAGPNYESIEQVQSDMASLVGRMKNLTTFIHNQNELGNLLGDDGPEILAEQEALQQKLESLRTQRNEMRDLVVELQDVNRHAEESAKTAKNLKNVKTCAEQKQTVDEASNSAPASERVVPVEYSRVVPIDVQSNLNDGSASDEAEATAALIQQKTADIEAMKAQMRRLKDMLDTVHIIEAHTSREAPKDVGRAPAMNVAPSANEFYDRESTPVAGNSDNISRKVRMLNEVTSDLRAQAASLQAERDRITALKAEIERRKQQAAAAAQLGEEALLRHSLTPTPTPSQGVRQQQEQLLAYERTEREHLKSEYEQKKKEFEMLCKRLEREDDAVHSSTSNNNLDDNKNRQNIVSDTEDDDADNTNELNYRLFERAQRARSVASNITVEENKSHQQQQQQQQEQTQQEQQALHQLRKDNDSVNANSTHDGASLEAASIQSGSSRSYFMPQPMPSVGASNWPGPMPPPLPTSWNPHFYYGVPPPGPPPAAPYTFTPPAYLAHPTPLLPSSASAAATATTALPTSTTGTEYLQTLLGAAGLTAPSSNTSQNADPVLLQQFVQTQQMLINSICQCNQTLWHQQREIDTINNIMHTLQERVSTLAATGGDLGFSIRSESVPPASLTAGSMPNNLYMNTNRAQSEQPLAYAGVSIGGGGGSAFTNYQQQHNFYQQQRHHQQQQQQHLRSGGTGYNYSTDSQQHVSNVSSVYQSTLNNAAAATAGNVAPPQPTTQFNNEAPQSPHLVGPPGPIFMHHHNNAIHQNNANLRTQNHYANNLQQPQQSNLNTTLNNQVPPGNRANNYWDNFRR